MLTNALISSNQYWTNRNGRENAYNHDQYINLTSFDDWINSLSNQIIPKQNKGNLKTLHDSSYKPFQLILDLFLK